MTRNATLNDERVCLIPTTLPVRSTDDLTPYHWVRNERGNLTLRKGAPPKVVLAAAADFASGKDDLNTMLDRIGVPKS